VTKDKGKSWDLVGILFVGILFGSGRPNSTGSSSCQCYTQSLGVGLINAHKFVMSGKIKPVFRGPHEHSFN